jgi:heme/copper-type cytochrome/quinol oxidase subunit 2
MTPPMQANNTNQKIDPVVISIYAMLSVVVIGTLVCFAIFIIGRRKGVY